MLTYQQRLVFAHLLVDGFECFRGQQLGGGEYKVMLRTATLLPIQFLIGSESEALVFSHSSGKHIGVILFVDNKVAVLVVIEKAWCKFIELEASAA